MLYLIPTFLKLDEKYLKGKSTLTTTELYYTCKLMYNAWKVNLNNTSSSVRT